MFGGGGGVTLRGGGVPLKGGGARGGPFGGAFPGALNGVGPAGRGGGTDMIKGILPFLLDATHNTIFHIENQKNGWGAMRSLLGSPNAIKI